MIRYVVCRDGHTSMISLAWRRILALRCVGDLINFAYFLGMPQSVAFKSFSESKRDLKCMSRQAADLRPNYFARKRQLKGRHAELQFQKKLYF